MLCDEDVVPTKKNSPLNRDEKDTVNDPMDYAVRLLMTIPSISDKFKNVNLDRDEKGKFNFIANIDINLNVLAESLIELHKNYANIYQEIINVFTDPNRRDSLDMPLFDSDQIYQNITTFIQKMRRDHLNNGSLEDQEKITKLTTLWLRLARVFKVSSKEIIEQEERLFLRSPAYTLLLEVGEDDNWHINLDPRVISTGNALHTLNFLKRPDKESAPTEEWWEMRKKMVDEIV